jgi:hypothetical protein
VSVNDSLGNRLQTFKWVWGRATMRAEQAAKQILPFVMATLVLSNLATANEQAVEEQKGIPILPPIEGQAQLYYKYRKPDALKLEAFPGRTLEFEVRIETFGSSTISLKLCRQSFPKVPKDGSAVPLLVTCQRDARPYHEGSLTVTTYTCSAEIDKSAEPRTYKLDLEFQLPDEIQHRYMDLPVGSQNSTRLQIETETPEPVTILTGDSVPISVAVTNNYPDYPVTIIDVKPQSHVPGLLKSYEVKTHLPIKLGASGDTKNIDVLLHTGMALSQLLQGSDQTPPIDLTLYYHDGIRDQVETHPPHHIKIKLGVDPAATLLCAFVGSVIGVIIRVSAEKLRATQNAPRMPLGTLILVSPVLGVMVVLLAQVVKPELLFFAGQFRLSYDNPITGFIVGFLVALVDPQTIIEFMKRRFTGDQESPGG